MNYAVLFVFSLSLIQSLPAFSQIGEKVPDYTFLDILNRDNEKFTLSEQKKPLIIEFWATWCSPCIPAMKKLEEIQDRYGDQLEILTVSIDQRENLLRYIQNTSTDLRIAFDTTHIQTFNYRYLSTTFLIDENGIIKAVTYPKHINDAVLEDFINGRDLNLPNILKQEEEIETNELVIISELKDLEVQYSLTHENNKEKFSNKILRTEVGTPYALDFKNVSLVRLFSDIYELPTSARLHFKEISDLSSIEQEKYCFTFEKSDASSINLLEEAKKVLNEHLKVKAEPVSMELDSVITLVISDESKLPKESKAEKMTYEYIGPYFRGGKIPIDVLVAYLENEFQEPVEDLTDIIGKYDIELNWNFENPRSINTALEVYGLKLERSSHPLTIDMVRLYIEE